MTTPDNPASRRLPQGFTVRLRDDLIQADGGAVLVGGSPLRAVRLSARAQRLLCTGTITVTDHDTALLARRLLDGNLADPVLDTIPPPHDQLTVVIPVRDRAEQLDRCLFTLDGLPVIVVDDASHSPDTVAAVTRRHGATLVSLTANTGPAGARNAGLARVTTPLVAFVDSDIRVTPDTLLSLVRHCADPQLALVSPRVVGECNRERPRWFERYDITASSLDLGPTGGQVRPGAAIAWLPSACLVGRVALIGDGFDTDLRVAEDVDLVWRLTASGLVVRYDPSQQAHHEVRATVRAWLGRKFTYGTGGAELGKRHGNKIAPAVLSLPMAIGAAAILTRRPWAAPIAAASIAFSTRALRRTLPVRDNRTLLASRLSIQGLGWVMRQEINLLLRHWWPLAVFGAAINQSTRRAILTALLLDLVEFTRKHPGTDMPAALIARRLDDVAYGAGLWWGAIRRLDRSCLVPRLA